MSFALGAAKTACGGRTAGPREIRIGDKVYAVPRPTSSAVKLTADRAPRNQQDGNRFQR